jgi:hypothetical protein
LEKENKLETNLETEFEGVAESRTMVVESDIENDDEHMFYECDRYGNVNELIENYFRMCEIRDLERILELVG